MMTGALSPPGESHNTEKLALFINRAKIVFVVFLVAVAATAVYTILSPKIYRAKSVLFVYSDILTETPANAVTLAQPFGTSTAQDYAMAILRSDGMAVAVGEKLKLDQDRRFLGRKPGSPIPRDDLIRMVKTKIKVVGSSNRQITVLADARNPALAADMANAYVDLLQGMILDRAAKRYDFLSEQMDKTRKELAVSEDDLKRFQEKNRMVALDDQVRATILMQADLEKDLLMKQITVAGNNRLAATSGSVPELVQLEAENTAVRAKMALLEQSLERLNSRIAHLPESALKLARLTREVRVKDELFKTLAKELESRRIQEQDEILPYRIIDRAYPPRYKHRPSLRSNLFFGGAIGLFLGVLLALVLDSLENIVPPAAPAAPGAFPPPVSPAPGPKPPVPNIPLEPSPSPESPTLRPAAPDIQEGPANQERLALLKTGTDSSRPSFPPPVEIRAVEPEIKKPEPKLFFCKECGEPVKGQTCEACENKTKAPKRIERVLCLAPKPATPPRGSLICTCGTPVIPPARACGSCGKETAALVRETIRQRLSNSGAGQAPETRTCKKCQAVIPSDSGYCRNCGYPIYFR